MTKSQKSTQKEPQQSGSSSSSPVIDPINIARARHASIHSQSILDKSAKSSSARATKPLSETSSSQGSKSRSVSKKTEPSLFSGANGCLLVVLMGMFFLVGGVLGGMVGGGLLLWISNSEGLALGPTPTPTLLPTPTPAPAVTLPPTPTPQPSVTPSTEDIIAQIIPSVVTVINQQHQAYAYSDEEGRVVGSGVIVDQGGYSATNNHVVQNPGSLSVVLADGREVPAELVAVDPGEDLAILKVGIEGLPAIHWGDSDTVRLGQTVYAIGSPLGDFPNSVSFGIVSGLNRALEINEYVIDGLIQTDAAINRGSSGGPLINMQGEMIGINTFIIRESEDRGIAEGIAFSIPSATARQLLEPWIAAHRGESVPIPASEESGNK